MPKHAQFYIQFSPPSAIWPNGSWALYETNSEDIAKRYGFDECGNVTRRDGLAGYVGMFGSVEALADRMAIVAT